MLQVAFEHCLYDWLYINLPRRVARIWKRGGGYFETVRSVQTTLTRISFRRFVRNVSEIQRFFPPKIRWSPKKKKKRSSPKFRVIFRPKSKSQRFFLPKIRWSQKKKKKVFAKIQGDFSSNFAFSNVWGGLFSIFHRKSASKAQKTCDFAYFTSQWGGLEPPPPPTWLRYWIYLPHKRYN